MSTIDRVMTRFRDLPSHNPLELFDIWINQAAESELNDPNAAALATATPDGIPSVRMVLAKRVDDHPFCFFTNAESRKGEELAANGRAALCFHWKSLRRQVRVEGPVSLLSSDKVDTYFHSRSRKSQLGASVSHQSRPLSSRDELESRFQSLSVRTTGEVPRPDFWRGFRLQPKKIEFWLDGPDRLHDRFLFTMHESTWQHIRLYP